MEAYQPGWKRNKVTWLNEKKFTENYFKLFLAFFKPIKRYFHMVPMFSHSCLVNSILCISFYAGIFYRVSLKLFWRIGLTFFGWTKICTMSQEHKENKIKDQFI